MSGLLLFQRVMGSGFGATAVNIAFNTALATLFAAQKNSASADKACKSNQAVESLVKSPPPLIRMTKY